MVNEDTINLLKECDAGTKTAVSSIKEVLDNVKSKDLLSAPIRLIFQTLK